MNNTLKPLDEVTGWLDAGRVLRQRLLDEKEQILSRLEEIDAALSSLPDQTEDSAPEKVKRVLRAGGGPMSAPQLIDAIRATEPVLDARLVHSALYRLAQRGDVIAEGERGSRVYRWSGQEVIVSG